MGNGEEIVQNKRDGKTEADEGAQTQPKVEPPLPIPPRKRAIWGISYIKRKLQERKAKREQKTPADKAAHITAVATFWIAGFTFVLAILSGLTWWEIHTGGTDTHDLAIQAKNQADRTKTIADQAVIQANAAKSAAITAERALTQSSKIVQLDERPWVYISSFALTAEPEVGKEPPKISFFPTNSGRTPALNITSFYETFTSPTDGKAPISRFETNEPPRASILPPNFSGAIITTFPIKSVMDPTRLAAYGVGAAAIYIDVKIDYSDSFHNRYWTTVCAYHTHDVPVGVFTACKTGNAVGQYRHSDTKGEQKAN
jgi:hypothetical protein